MTVTEVFKATSDDQPHWHLDRYFGLWGWTGNECAGSHFDSVDSRVADFDFVPWLNGFQSAELLGTLKKRGS